MQEPPKQVLVIGASGMVGMATVASLHYFTSHHITACDLPADDNKRAERQARKSKFAELKTQSDLLDKRQANWIMKNHPGTPNTGNINYSEDRAACIASNPDIIVITAGNARTAGRAPDEKFSPLVPLNTPYFYALGNDIADAYANTAKENPHAQLPTVINTGNPVDTMTELLVRTISQRLGTHLRTAMSGDQKDTKLASILGRAIKQVPTKILGQGGVIDSARAAMAISETTGIPLERITEAPVLGPHNAHMHVNFEGVRIRANGHSISLIDALRERGTPTLTQAQRDHINALTRQGAEEILHDTKAKTGQSQGAVFGTAAAVTIMVEAATHDHDTRLCASAYDPITGRAMGRYITLNHNGARLSTLPTDHDLAQKLQNGIEALTTAYQAAEEVLGHNHKQRTIP